MESSPRSSIPKSPSSSQTVPSSALKDALENTARIAGIDFSKRERTNSKQLLSPHLAAEEEDQLILDERHHTRIKSGSVVKILQRVTCEEKFQKGNVKPLLLTYRLVGLTPARLLELLINRFSESDATTQKCVSLVFRRWVQIAPRDFLASESLSGDLSKFLEKNSSTDDEVLAILKECSKTLKKLRKDDSDEEFTLTRKISDSASISSDPVFVFRMSSADVIARHLVRLDHLHLSRVREHELLPADTWAANSSNEAVVPPSIAAMQAWCRAVEMWICTEVLCGETAEERATNLVTAIEIAKECLRLNDFSGIMCVLAALQSPALKRLTRSWNLLPGSTLADVETLSALMTPLKGFAQYRKHLRSVKSRDGVAFVPYFDLLLVDLAFVEDAEPSILNESQTQTDTVSSSASSSPLSSSSLVSAAVWNFEKARQIAHHIKRLQRAQQTAYEPSSLGAVDSEILSAILSSCAQQRNVTAAQLMHLSSEAEPLMAPSARDAASPTISLRTSGVMMASSASPSLIAPSSPFFGPSHASDSHSFSRRLSSASMGQNHSRKPSASSAAHPLVPRSSSNSFSSASDPTTSPATNRRIQIRIGHFEKAKKELALEKEKLTQDEWEEIYSIAQIQHFRPNESIIEEGAINRFWYRIKSGEVRIEKSTLDTTGQRHVMILDIIGPGHAFGEHSLLDPSGKTTAAVVAETEVELYEVKYSEFDRLFETEVDLGCKIYKNLARKLASRLRSLPMPTKKLAIDSGSRKSSTNSTALERAREEKRRTDEKLLSRFQLPRDESLLRDFSCQWKKKCGRLYLFSRHLAFYARSFGISSKETFPYEVLSAVEMMKDSQTSFSINTSLSSVGKIRVDFRSAAECASALSTLMRSWRNVDVDLNTSASCAASASIPASTISSSAPTRVSSVVSMSPVSLTFLGGATPPSGSDSTSDTSSTGGALSGVNSRTGLGRSSIGGSSSDRDAHTITTGGGDGGDTSGQALGREEWDFILRGARTRAYSRDQVIIAQGQHHQAIFYVAQGSCRIEHRASPPGLANSSPSPPPPPSSSPPFAMKGASGSPREGSAVALVSVVREGEIFGELTFVDAASASATVIANEDVQLQVIEGHFLSSLFTLRPEIEPKFFRYLSIILASRLKEREQALSFAERKAFLPSMDISKKYRRQKDGIISQKMGGTWHRRLTEVTNGVLVVFSPSATEVLNGSSGMSPSLLLSGSRGSRAVKRVHTLEGASVRLSDLQPNCFKLSTPKWTQYFSAESSEEMLEWMGAFSYWSEQPKYNRYESFAAVREESSAQWFVDGADTYAAIADAIDAATEMVFMCDWFLIPEIYLRRSHPCSAEDRLDRTLLRAARRGVQVYVLIWHETTIAISLNSAGAKKKLEALHPNIHVLRHPPLEPLNWSHHQKIVVLDSDVAFVGGLDVCYGRWDTNAHRITDDCHVNQLWPGQDYMNPRYKQYEDVDVPFIDLIDREHVPRMGWHDVHVRFDGEAARDVAQNFLQRWNHHKAALGADAESYAYLIPKTSPVLPPHKRQQKFSSSPTCAVQIVRSICDWSGGNRLEVSLQNAYLDLIEKSEHFIYMENQYFISCTAGGGVENLIARALLERLRRAIRDRAVFRVIVLLPVHPDGTFEDSASVRYIMKWQYDSICRGGSSLLETLSAEFPDVSLNNYITFNSLRNYAFLNDVPVTEQIYVHSKMMIVDDRVAIIGSANINDRSMNGNRDSEIAAVITDSAIMDSQMNGIPFKATKFAHTLRRALFCEHLGLPPNDPSVQDPVLASVYHDKWNCTAAHNTAIYARTFSDIPHDTIHTLNLYEAMRKKRDQQQGKDAIAALSTIKGHVIEFPLKFLQGESLKPAKSNIPLNAVDRAIFQ